MTTYVALLRGINVGGHAKIGMAELRQVCARLGYLGVKTYLQSGNLIFRHPADESSRLTEDIEKHIARDLGVRVTVLLRTQEELAQVVANNPFLSRVTDLSKLHVTFLADAPDRERVARFDKPVGEPAEFSLVGREVYLHCPDGYGRTKLNNAYIERRLGLAATTRNWNTVTKLGDLASD